MRFTYDSFIEEENPDKENLDPKRHVYSPRSKKKDVRKRTALRDLSVPNVIDNSNTSVTVPLNYSYSRRVEQLFDSFQSYKLKHKNIREI
ncbi:hypothetical protein CWI37_1295p0010 [Hamiltosporidium tvaerminnensis]|uniref:Uncharacterized protein n=1 Tax=Hamiltosporidium tvaerminnensis TaxID=1176355 RepID=A0A4Q9KZC6_9MICR|nr:hypothetical protein CWI37_1295p0010 [Hamiltosporidium tvaerminnensis]